MLSQTMIGNRALDTLSELLALLVKAFNNRLIAVDLHGCDRRCHCMGFRPMGGGKQKDAGIVGLCKPTQLHIGCLASQGGNCKAIAQCLAKAGKIWLDIIKPLCAAHVKAKPGDHLVKNKQGTVFMSDPSCLMQKIRLRLVHARWFENEGGNSSGIIFKKGFHRAKVIIAECRGQGGNCSRDPSIHPGCANEPVIGRKERVVRATGDHVTSCIGARETDGSRSCIRSILAEFDHFRAIDQFQETLGAFNLNRAWTGEIAAVLQRIANSLQHGRISVAKTHRTIAHAIFDILVAIDIKDMRTRAALYKPGRKHGILIVSFRIGVTTTGNKRMGFASEQLRIVKPGGEKVHVLVLRWLFHQTGVKAVFRRSLISRNQFLTGLGSRLRRLE